MLDGATLAIVPGDPGRVEQIAHHLDDPSSAGRPPGVHVVARPDRRGCRGRLLDGHRWAVGVDRGRGTRPARREDVSTGRHDRRHPAGRRARRRHRHHRSGAPRRGKPALRADGVPGGCRLRVHHGTRRCCYGRPGRRPTSESPRRATPSTRARSATTRSPVGSSSGSADRSRTGSRWASSTTRWRRRRCSRCAASSGLRAGCVAGVLVNRTQQETPDEAVIAAAESNAVTIAVDAAGRLLPPDLVPHTRGVQDRSLAAMNAR